MLYEVDGIVYKSRQEARAVSKNFKRIPQWNCDENSIKRKPQTQEKRKESMWQKMKANKFFGGREK